ncbi:MAG: RodZ domain-containing protein [Pseudomonadota bacterium]
MADEVVVNVAETEVIGFAPLGEVFSDARNAKKLALKDVSNNLRLSIKQIDALENNDFSSLPPAVITRGFIRNYARFLELDAEPLLASYRMRMPDASPSTLNVKTSMNQVMPGKDGSSLLKYVLLISLVLLSVGAWFYYINYMQKTAQRATESAVSVVAVEAPAQEVVPLPEVALPVAERLAQADAEAAANVPAVAGDAKEASNQTALGAAVLPKAEQAQQLPANGSAVTTQNLQLPKEATVDSNTLKEGVAKTASATASAKVTAAEIKVPDLAKNSLTPAGSIAANKGVSIAVTEQTWVRVTDKTGAVVYEKMLQPNSEDGFNGLLPFKVLIGNAKATKLTFLGQNIDLSDKTKNNVARLTLE